MNTLKEHSSILILFIVFLFFASESFYSQTTYYVDSSGGGDFTTIQDAYNAASNGDTIIVRDGTYTENLSISKELTFKSENGYQSTKVVSGTGGDVFFSTAANVTIDGFDVYGATNLQRYGILVGLGNNCKIINNRCGYDATHNNHYGIRSDHADNTIISNNICNSNIEYAILLSLGDNILVSSNTCSNNDRGMILSEVTNSTVINNTITNNTVMGIVTYNTANVKLRGNFIDNNTNFGVYIYEVPVPDLGQNNLTDKGRNTFTNHDYDVYNDCSSTVDAYYNYWGTTTESAIEDNIFDDDDDVSKGAILFDPWLESDQSLPVHLISFSAREYNGNIILEWITGSEFNTLGYIISRRKENQIDWQEISSYRTNDNLKCQGNSTYRQEYIFTDTNVHIGSTYYYRLCDIDYDNKVTLHDIISITLKADIASKTKLDSPFPNPFNPKTKVTFCLAKESKIYLNVFDIRGRLVRHLIQGEQKPAGNHSVFWYGCNDKGQATSSGTYLVILKTEDTIYVQKIILIH